MKMNLLDTYDDGTIIISVHCRLTPATPLGTVKVKLTPGHTLSVWEPAPNHCWTTIHGLTQWHQQRIFNFVNRLFSHPSNLNESQQSETEDKS